MGFYFGKLQMAYFHILQVADKSQIHQVDDAFYFITFPLERFLEHTAQEIKDYYIDTDNNQLNFLKQYPAVVTIEQFEDEINLVEIIEINKNEELRSISVKYKIHISISAPTLPDSIIGNDLFNTLKPYKENRDSIQNVLDFSNLEMTRFHWAIKNGNLFERSKNSFLSSIQTIISKY